MFIYYYLQNKPYFWGKLHKRFIPSQSQQCIHVYPVHMSKRGSVEKEVARQHSLPATKKGELREVLLQSPLDELDSVLNVLLETYQVSAAYLLHLLKEKADASSLTVPLSLFSSRTLSPLQTVLKFGVEQKQLTFHQLSKLIHKKKSMLEKAYLHAE